MYVRYGCGLSAPVGWRNFDASPALRLQRLAPIGPLLGKRGVPFPSNVEFGDVTARLPVPDGACAGVYCSHVLEHLSLEDCRKALRETLRILKPDGVFRAVLPDLEHIVRAYMDGRTPTAAIAFMRATLLGKERHRSLPSFLREWLGNSHHLWLWDCKALATELVDAGFRAIRRAEFGDAADPQFREVEDKDRWNGCLGIECLR